MILARINRTRNGEVESTWRFQGGGNVVVILARVLSVRTHGPDFFLQLFEKGKDLAHLFPSCRLVFQHHDGISGKEFVNESP